MTKPDQLSVLLIDDDPEMRSQFQIIMDYHHLHLDAADNATSGLDYLTRSIPDVVVVDMLLPDLNGYEVLARVRENPATRNVKVILTTTYYNIDTKDNVLQHGFDGYIPKPINVTNLVPYIERIVRG